MHKAADDPLLEYIDKSFPYTPHPPYGSLNDCADKLLSVLKSAMKKKKEIEIYSLDKQLIDSVGILAESGEARIYRNTAQRLCVRYAKPSLLSSLFSLSSQ